MTTGRRWAALAAALLVLAGAAILIRPQNSPARPAPRHVHEEGSGAPAPRDAAEAAPGSGAAPPAAPAPSIAEVRPRTFRIQDASGRPRKASIRLMISWDQFKTFRMIDLDADASGLAEAAIDPAAWVLMDVRGRGLRGQLRSPVTWGDLPDEPLEFALEEAVPVELRPTYSDGEPLADTKLRLTPEWSSGDYAGLAATRMNIVDEETRTDATGRVRAVSLRQGNYVLSFPDHPKWPGIRISAEALTRSPLPIKVPWPRER